MVKAKETNGKASKNRTNGQGTNGAKARARVAPRGNGIKMQKAKERKTEKEKAGSSKEAGSKEDGNLAGTQLSREPQGSRLKSQNSRRSRKQLEPRNLVTRAQTVKRE